MVRQTTLACSVRLVSAAVLGAALFMAVMTPIAQDAVDILLKVLGGTEPELIYGSAREDVWGCWPDGRPLFWPTTRDATLPFLALASIGILAIQIAATLTSAMVFRVWGRPKYFTPPPIDWPGWPTIMLQSAARSSWAAALCPSITWLVWLFFARMVAPAYDTLAAGYHRGGFSFHTPSIDLNPASAFGVFIGTSLIMIASVTESMRDVVLSTLQGSRECVRLCPACSYPSTPDGTRCSECGMCSPTHAASFVLAIGSKGAIHQAIGRRSVGKVLVAAFSIYLLAAPVSFPLSIYLIPSRTLSQWSVKGLRTVDEGILRVLGVRRPLMWTPGIKPLCD